MWVLAIYTALYATSVLLTGALCVVSQLPPPAKSTANYRMAVMILSTLVTEFPQIFLGFKFLILYFASAVGVLDPANGIRGIQWLYRLDIAVFLMIWAFFLQSYFARFVVEEQTKMYRAVDSHDPPGFFHLGYWFRLLNPFWYARNVMVHPDICYATDAELKHAGPAAEPYMSLDVHIHPSYPRNRPILIYIHGGSWSMGDKTITTPAISYMALKRWVVVSVNYRLTPHVKYPEHLIDVKRAIRWVRQHAVRYGGDPNFIAISGNSAGGHLAAMAAMTPNDPYYQPGFENVDTTVQACVGMNPVLDVTNHKRYWKHKFQEWFASSVAGLPNGFAANEELMQASSPVILLKRMEAQRRKSNKVAAVAGIDVEDVTALAGPGPDGRPVRPSGPRVVTGTEQLPPFLLFTGRADILVPFRSTRDFVQSFKKISKSPICYVEFPNANHMYDILSAPRAHYMAYGIERFLGRMYERHVAAVAAGEKEKK
ncbi:Alpha/Beta hydrolase protein [Powellomyces hirtus]|nr:Alpha/Beta hydrolase protein [Powellomyces hirtus]